VYVCLRVYVCVYVCVRVYVRVRVCAVALLLMRQQQQGCVYVCVRVYVCVCCSLASDATCYCSVYFMFIYLCVACVFVGARVCGVCMGSIADQLQLQQVCVRVCVCVFMCVSLRMHVLLCVLVSLFLPLVWRQQCVCLWLCMCVRVIGGMRCACHRCCSRSEDSNVCVPSPTSVCA